jgi:hypothetical protein
MQGATDAPIIVTGLARNLTRGGMPTALRVDMAADGFMVRLEGQPPYSAAYRDLTTIGVDQGQVLLVLGEAMRLIADQLGAGLATLVGELRERRARQMLTDRLIDLPAHERLELVEYAAGDEHGVAQLAVHPWGAALMPLDERRAWRLVRRADIAAVRPDQSAGRVAVEVAPRPGRAGYSFEMLGLGLDTVRMSQRLTALYDTALSDVAAIVAGLLVDAPPGIRQLASGLLIDGRPASRAELGDAWGPIERAVLSEPTFAASYAALAGHSASAAGQSPSWISLAPVRPTDPTVHKSWFLVGLPGGLLAFELVSEGAHATYLFRANDSYEAAAFDVSECLIDMRFLREPIYLAEDALAGARYLRYRLAIAALPTLRAARARFVGRLIHSDEESWARSLDDAVAWNAANQDASAVWPGTDQSEGD